MHKEQSHDTKIYVIWQGADVHGVAKISTMLGRKLQRRLEYNDTTNLERLIYTQNMGLKIKVLFGWWKHPHSSLIAHYS